MPTGKRVSKKHRGESSSRLGRGEGNRHGELPERVWLGFTSTSHPLCGPSCGLQVQCETPGVKEKGLLERDGPRRGRRRRHQGMKEGSSLDKGVLVFLRDPKTESLSLTSLTSLLDAFESQGPCALPP